MDSKFLLQKHTYYSHNLQREVTYEVILPPDYEHSQATYRFLVLNDGQDSKAMRLRKIIERMVPRQEVVPIIIFSMFCGDRVQEYGTAEKADYQGRGSKASAYTAFIIEEFLPTMRHHWRLANSQNAIAGYSLGGLSAFDIAFHHPDVFQYVGVFSGALWWRSKKSSGRNPDANRIAHEVVSKGVHYAGQKFWFQAGTHDETDDRNNNGVIDSIDDTLDLISALVKIGYRAWHDIEYVEVEGGEHNHATWSKVMPDFLRWAFKKPF